MTKVEETLSKLTEELKIKKTELNVLYKNERTGTIVAEAWCHRSKFFCVGNQTGYLTTGCYYAPEARIYIDSIEEDSDKIVVHAHGTITVDFGMKDSVGDIIFDKSKLAPYGTACELVKW